MAADPRACGGLGNPKACPAASPLPMLAAAHAEAQARGHGQMHGEAKQDTPRYAMPAGAEARGAAAEAATAKAGGGARDGCPLHRCTFALGDGRVAKGKINIESGRCAFRGKVYRSVTEFADAFKGAMRRARKTTPPKNDNAAESTRA